MKLKSLIRINVSNQWTQILQYGKRRMNNETGFQNPVL